MSHSLLGKKEGTAPIDPSLRGLAGKIKRKNVKISTIVSKCEAVDLNEDGIIHIADLEDVLMEIFGPEAISRREMAHLSRLLQSEGQSEGFIDYHRLYDVLEQQQPSKREDAVRDEQKETWYDPAEILNRREGIRKRGSVGEWLQTASCPAEAANFRLFIRMLEDFERESGMKCQPTDSGFIVPLGPDLRASVSFSLQR